jgi:hypothetical protein
VQFPPDWDAVPRQVGDAAAVTAVDARMSFDITGTRPAPARLNDQRDGAGRRKSRLMVFGSASKVTTFTSPFIVAPDEITL